MPDAFSKKRRSEIMSRITSKNTKPELIIRKALFAEGYRYRLYGKKLPGNPDIVFSSKKKVIFINGCFWHGHNCKRAALPKTNTQFWKKKIDGNKERDNKNYKKLYKMGWGKIVVWQCKIKKTKMENTLRKIKYFLNEGVP